MIAYDFTGAADIGSMLVRGGLRVIQTIGPPGSEFDFGEADSVAVALKSYSILAPDAVGQSLSALNALRQAGISRVQSKYRSTFESTPTAISG